MQAVTNGYSPLSQYRTKDYPRGPVEILGICFYFSRGADNRKIVGALLDKQLEFVRSIVKDAKYNQAGELITIIKNKSRLGSKCQSRILPSLSRRDLEKIVAKL